MTYAAPRKEVAARFGCTTEEWRTLRDIGAEEVRQGKSYDTTPLRAYARQRISALKQRGIGWELTLWQWWTIWQDSGHWHERSGGRGYMMCRNGDTGPYAVGNVFIGRGDENSAAGSKKSGLPLGVRASSHSKLKPYMAVCMIADKQRYVGSYATPAEAHAAYLVARAADMARREPMRKAA
jgi:hypothetical protein